MATRMSDQVRAYCIDKGFSGEGNGMTGNSWLISF